MGGTVGYALGSFRLDTKAEILYRGGEPTAVGQRAVTLLRALVERAREPVSKDELMAAAWPGLVVEDSNLAVQIAALRRTLGEEAGGESWIETLPRRGYRYVGPVTAMDEITAGAGTIAPVAIPPKLHVKPDKPSIAVLPFDNMSSDKEQDFFADGLVEDIITTLSKLSGLLVIARNSSFVYKGKSLDVRTVAKELGVRYVLEGSVRKAGDRIRITAQLIDGGTGAHLWAERYDRSIDDIFAIQDAITLVLATELQVKLIEGDQARLRSSTTSNVEAWTKWTEGLGHYRGPVTKDNHERARRCWEHALMLDPSSAAVNAMLGFEHYVDARFGWWDDRDTALRKGSEYVDRALAIDPDNADAHMTRGLLLLVMGRYDDAVIHALKSVELAPSSADAATFASFVLASSGFAEEAVVQIEKAMALCPHYPASYLGHLGNAYRLSGRTQQAIEAFTAYDERSPGFGLSDLVLTYQLTGQPGLAKQAAERLLSARKSFTIGGWEKTQFRKDTAQLAAEVAALREAGLPEG